MPQIAPDLETLHRLRAGLTGRVAFVPTMGFLHEGHAELLRVARAQADHVVLSIYVNPTQFGPDEDLDAYPRDMARDLALAAELGVDVVFTPSDAVMYPPGHRTLVRVEDLSAGLCGASRPVHFDGVATIVTKLFLAVRPDVAVFGDKDYQQITIIRRLVTDLGLPITIVGVDTVREADGLAKSSRNKYLDAEARAAAPALSQGMRAAWRAWQAGERDIDALLAAARAPIDAAPGARVDYIQIVHPDTLAALTGRAQDAEGAHLALAVHLGGARLIDNLRLSAPLPAALQRIEAQESAP